MNKTDTFSMKMLHEVKKKLSFFIDFFFIKIT